MASFDISSTSEPKKTSHHKIVADVSIEQVTTVQPGQITNTPTSSRTTESVKRKRKRVKKTRMKDIMAGMMNPSKTTEQLRQEHQENIRKSLGGGGFQKLERV